MNADIENKGYYIPQQGYATEVATKTFMTQVFLWMTFAMAITAVTAYLFASSESLIMSLRNPETHGLSGLGWIVTLAPIGFVLLMSLGFQKLSPALMALLFITFSVLMGMSLSFILLVYTAASVYKTFAVTAAMFGGMSILGYTDRKSVV